jgi:hypothetical protein
MGWHTTALYVQGTTAAEAVAVLGPADPTDQWVEPDRASTGPFGDRVYAAEVGGWAQVWHAPFDLITDCDPPGPAAVVAFFSGVVSTYGFTLFADGAMVRQFVHSEGVTLIDEGQPLAVETAFELPSWGPDEDYIWAVITAVTGTTYDDDVTYRAYTLR